VPVNTQANGVIVREGMSAIAPIGLGGITFRALVSDARLIGDRWRLRPKSQSQG